MTKATKNKRTILIFQLLLVSCIYDSTLITAHINTILNDVVKNQIYAIAIIIGSRRLTRMLFDIPLGMISDKYLKIGQNITIAIAFKIVFLLFILYKKSFVFLLIATIFEGISVSFFRGKISVFQYNTLKLVKKESIFYKFNSLYNIILYSFTSIVSIASIWIAKKYTINNIIQISILTLLLPLIISICLTNKIKKYPQSKAAKTSDKIEEKFHYKDISKKILGLCIMLGVSSLGWEINTMNQFLTMQTTQNSLIGSHVFQYGSMAMLFSSLLAYKIEIKNINKLSIIFICILIINIVTNFIIPTKYIHLPILIYLSFFVLYTNSLSKEIIKNSNKNHKNYIISLSTIITSITGLLITFLFHYIGHSINYKIGNFITFIVILIIFSKGFYLYYKK